MPARPRNRLRAWLFLVLALSAVVLFAVVLGPGLRRLPGIRSVTGRTEAAGIDAGSLFYTETDAFDRANLRSSATFMGDHRP